MLKAALEEKVSENHVRAYLRGPAVRAAPPPPSDAPAEEAGAPPSLPAADGVEGVEGAEGASAEGGGAADEPPRAPPSVVSRGQFVQRLMRWPWLREQFEVLAAQNHLKFDDDFVRRVLGAMFDELLRLQGSAADGARVRPPAPRAAPPCQRPTPPPP